MPRLRAAALAVTVLACACATPGPPVARTVDEVVVTLHGEPRRDEYAWLRAGGDDPAVRAHLDAENAHAAAAMRRHRRLMRALGREIEARVYLDHDGAPVRRGAWLYWTRHERRRDHPVYLRRRVDAPADAAEVVLDLDALARGKPFLALGELELSDDGHHLAYTIDEEGAEDYRLFIKDLRTGALGPDRLERVTSVAWAAGGRELLYTVRDDTFRAYALRSHVRGEAGEGRLLYTEADPRFDLSVARSRSGEWLMLAADSATTSEVRVARADRPGGAWTVLAPRSPGHMYDIDHSGDRFYVRSNLGAPNFRVLFAPEDDPAVARWQELVPARDDVAISAIDAFAARLVVTLRERGEPRLVIVDPATGAAIPAGAPALRRGLPAIAGGLVTLTAGENPDPAATAYRVHVESAHEPERTVDVALTDGAETVVDRLRVPGSCGGEVRERGAARAADGVEVPYLRFAGRGAARGPRPVLLEVYGAYGVSDDPDFDPARCSLLERGVDLVIAWVRGGGELGEPWHDAARLHARETATGDLIAVAEQLVAAGRTARETLVVLGESAGGGLVATALNARPELFSGAVLRVPFLDAVGTMADPGAPLTTVEYEEWGDPRVRADYDVLRRWCPYTNIRAQRYPPILVESSLADDRVAYHEQARWVARLRARARGGPFLLRTELHAGHGGASSRRDWLRARAFEAAFVLEHLGRATPR